MNNCINIRDLSLPEQKLISFLKKRSHQNSTSEAVMKALCDVEEMDSQLKELESKRCKISRDYYKVVEELKRLKDAVILIIDIAQ